jgi:hypothetical protein
MYIDGVSHVCARVHCIHSRLRFVGAGPGRSAAVYAPSSGTRAPIGRAAASACTSRRAARFSAGAHCCPTARRCPTPDCCTVARRATAARCCTTAHFDSIASQSAATRRGSSARHRAAERSSPHYSAEHATSRRKSPRALGCAAGSRKPEPTSDKPSASAGSLANTRASRRGNAPSPAIAGTAAPALARHAPRARSAA